MLCHREKAVTCLIFRWYVCFRGVWTRWFTKTQASLEQGASCGPYQPTWGSDSTRMTNNKCTKKHWVAIFHFFTLLHIVKLWSSTQNRTFSCYKNEYTFFRDNFLDRKCKTYIREFDLIVNFYNVALVIVNVPEYSQKWIWHHFFGAKKRKGNIFPLLIERCFICSL